MRVRSLLAVLLLVTTALSGCIAFDEEVTPAAVDPEATAAPFSDTAVVPGDYNLTSMFSQPLEDGVFSILDPEIVALASDLDGANVEIGVFLPDVPAGEQVPVLVYASPYIFGGMSPEGMRSHYMHTVLVENFVPHGYAVAFVPIRGTANNGGCMDLMGPMERADLDQAITWLGTQEWSNGNVAMYGASYDGSTPWEVASMGNPHLKTIVPVSGVNDLYHLMFKNGTNEYRGPGLLNALYYSFGFLSYNALENGRTPLHMVEGAACPESWEGLAASGYTGATGERDPTGFWEERNLRPGVEENYDGSILLVHGLQDWNVDPGHAYPWVNQLEDQGIVVKHMLGQWGHAFPDWSYENGEAVHPRMDWAEVMLQWFDHWLKGDTSVDLGPRAQVQDSSGEWRNEDTWPPEDTEATAYHAQPDGELALSTTSETATVTLTPRNDDLEPGVFGILGSTCSVGVCFATDTHYEPLRFAGIPTADLTVTPTGPGGHLEVRLYSIDGDGDWTRLGWGQVDLRFAHGGEEAQSVTPGETLEVRVWFEPLDAVVEPGERLLFRISQSSYGDHAPSAPSYPVELHLGDGQSLVTLDTFERPESVFFDPPSNPE